MNNASGIVVEESKENAENLKKALAERKKYETFKNVGEKLSNAGTPALIISLLSPFDFDGPVIEMISGAVVLVGHHLKNVGEKKLESLEGLNVNGAEFEKYKLDNGDSESINAALQRISRAAAEKRKNDSQNLGISM